MNFIQKIFTKRTINDTLGIEKILLLCLIIGLLGALTYGVFRVIRVFNSIDAIASTLNSTTLPLLNNVATEQNKFVQQEEEQFSTEKKKLFGTAGDILSDIKQTTNQLNTKIMPSLSGSIDNIKIATLNTSNATKQLPTILDSTNKDLVKLGDVIDRGKDILLDARRYIAKDQDSIKKILDDLAKTTANLVVISDPVILQQIENESRDTIGNAKKSLAELDGILADGHAVTTYYKGKIIPKPRTYSKNKFVAALQKTGLYVIDVLKETPGLILVTIKLITTGQ